MILRKVFRKIKKGLVKKVEIDKHYLDENHLTFEFKLTNYFRIKKPLEVQLLLEEEIHLLDYILIKRNRLLIKVPTQLLSLVNPSAQIKLYINKKLVWITESSDYEDYNQSLLIGNNYLTTIVNKNIRLRNRFSELSFNKDSLYTTINATHYNTLEFSLLLPLPQVDGKEIEIYFFNNNRYRIVYGIFDRLQQKIVLNDLTSLSAGLWRLFININNELIPLDLNEEYLESFKTYHHEIRVENKYSGFYLDIRPHSFDTGPITIYKLTNRNLKIYIEHKLDLPNTSFTLLLNEPQSGITKSYSLQLQNNNLSTIIDFQDLYENQFTKRFFIIQHNEEPTVCQFNLDKLHLSQSDVTFNTITDSQYVNVKFYKRRDKSLGLRVSRPVIKKSISTINDFQLIGYIGSLDRFVDSQAFLLLEDRISLKSIKIPISNHFTIDLLKWNLIDLKGKDKTVIDFYVIVENMVGDVIRKEKIRYRRSDYKKDNYYGHEIIEDTAKNQHHFLITTTPYNNLKLESFTVSNDIDLPKDTYNKDSNIWLIGERYNTAQDNGIVLFNWLQKNTNVEVYYVIEDDSPDYLHIQGNPNVLVFGSSRHFEIAVKAKVLLGTHDLENILPYKPAQGFFGYENTYKIFLQHGVLGRKNVEYHKKFYDLPFDLFIVSSDAEKYEIVIDEMGYDESEVVVTGLSRFDNLIQSEKPKDILLMPTWRDWINTDAQFLESEYYHAYSNLIQNDKLISLLNQYDVNLNFYPHYRAQDFFQNGIDNLDEKINFIQLGSETVQDLLINHALLITDFSSVSFDFTLLDKPVIYYHFDVKRFFKKGILRPIDETFIGSIASAEDELVSLIEDRIKLDFSNYENDISGIIKYQDHSNSERIYNEILTLMDKE